MRGAPPDAGPDGSAAGWTGRDARFTGAVAFGWDECLPTVAPCPDPADPAGSPLRDHGDLWGRPATVAGEGPVLATTWAGPTSPDDDLASAMAADRALVLAPAERVA